MTYEQHTRENPRGRCSRGAVEVLGMHGSITVVPQCDGYQQETQQLTLFPCGIASTSGFNVLSAVELMDPICSVAELVSLG